MVLIVFYLIVGRLASQTQDERGGKVTLPTTAVGTMPQGDERPLIITVRLAAQGEGTQPGATGEIENAPRVVVILLDGERVKDVESLSALLKALNAAERRVHLRADRAIPYLAVAPAIEACRAAGVASLRLVSQQATGNEP